METPDHPHCIATTLAGQPCKNRPFKDLPYCHVHAALAGPISGPESAYAPEQEVDITLSESQPARSEAATTLHELEVEIRNQDSEPDQADFAADTLRLIRENMERMSAEAVGQLTRLVRENINSDYLDPDFWQGIGMVLRYQVDELRGMIQRRLRGEYATDPYGMDQELIELLRPFATFMYRTWWRIQAEGIENVPAEGRVLLVSNHSGMLPWDSAMIVTALLEDHPQARMVRPLHDNWMASLPGLAPLLAALGQVPAMPANATRLLEEDQVVGVFPEGARGAGKLFRDRYRLANFAAEEWVRAAMRAGAPIVPVAVIGAEEAYPMLGNARQLAKALGLPYFPLTPLFPWLGAFGLIPLPSTWTMVFDTPITTAEYGAEGPENAELVSEIASRVRDRIQSLINERIGPRRSVLPF